MKNDNFTTALNLLLAALVILGVYFALRSMFLTRAYRTMQIQANQATQANGYRMALESIFNDTVAYSQKNPNPEILRILQSAQSRPANH